MKNIRYLAICLLTGICMLSACKREHLPIRSLATLNAVNAITDQSRVYINTLRSDIAYSQFPVIGYQSNQAFTLNAGDADVRVFAESDTVSALYDKSFTAVKGGSYSLYLSGNVSPYDALLLQDTIPAVRDSSAGVRFINLSPDSPPLKAVVQGTNDVEVSGLVYKQISDFKLHSAKSSIGGSHTFEIHDASSDVLLYTYTWYFRPFFCQTLVISGLMADNSFSIFSVNNF